MDIRHPFSSLPLIKVKMNEIRCVAVRRIESGIWVRMTKSLMAHNIFALRF